MNEEQQDFNADTGYEASSETDGGFSFEGQSDPTGEAATETQEGSGEVSLPEVPAGYKLLSEDEYNTLNTRSERATLYSKPLEMLEALGGPERIQQLLEESHNATIESQAEAEHDRVAGIFGAMAAEGHMDETAAAWLTEQFGPLAAELARMRPVIEQWKQETAGSRSERDIKSILDKYPTAYESSVRMAYEKGGLSAAEAEAKAYAAHIGNILKATNQRAAVDRAATNPKGAPMVEGVRNQPAPQTSPIPDPIKNRAAWEEYHARAMDAAWRQKHG